MRCCRASAKPICQRNRRPTNPAAKHDKTSPLYGMPILEVGNARSIIVLKRSMRPGFAGVDNDLYYNPKCMMLFGDAKESLNKLFAALKS